MIENRRQIKVRFSEIDSLGIAYNAAYYIWFEIGRFYFSEKILGLNLQTILTKYRFPVIKSACKYLYPIHFNEELFLDTFVYYHETMSNIEFFYKLYNCDHKMCAIGVTSHLLVDEEGKMNFLMDNYLSEHMNTSRKKYQEYYLTEQERKKWLHKINR